MKQPKRVRYAHGVRFLVLTLFLVWGISQGNVPVFAEETENLEGLIKALQIVVLDEPQKAPEFSLASVNVVDGEAKSLSDYRGQVIFLNFWTTW